MQLGTASFAAALPEPDSTAPGRRAEAMGHHNEALSGLDRVTVQMDNALLPHPKLLQSIGPLGTRVAPLLV